MSARGASPSLRPIRSGTIAPWRTISPRTALIIAVAEGMDVPFKRLQAVAPAEIRRFAESVLGRSGDCDALYLPCPQWQAAQIVDELERDVGIPAVAYTHASFFVAFKALGIDDSDRRSRPAVGVAGVE